MVFVDSIFPVGMDHRADDRLFGCIWRSGKLLVSSTSWSDHDRDANVRFASLWNEESRSWIGSGTCTVWGYFELGLFAFRTLERLIRL